MSGCDLGWRRRDGQLSAGNNPFGAGCWAVVFDPLEFAVSTGTFEIWHIALKGPVGSQFEVWIDDTFYDNNYHGDVNSWDPNEPMKLKGGNTLYLYWNTGAAPAPLVTVWLREPSAI